MTLPDDRRSAEAANVSRRDETHAVPLFEGKGSHRHRRSTLDKLKAEAQAWRAAEGAVGPARTLVQFAGFPRSGHSIVGSLLDAHANAIVSHELDIMGLVAAGFSREEIFALIAANSAAFEASGRYWNGFSYAVEGGHGGRAEPLHVIGDKKGDWAVRRVRDDLGMVDRLRDVAGDMRVCWISVIRNPFDNIATLSLRKGRKYDRLRISEGSERFREVLEAEKGRSLSGSVLPEMLEDYAQLCAGIAALKRQCAPADWYELHLDRLTAAPEQELGKLLAFLELDQAPDFVHRAARVIAREPSRTRHVVDWGPGQRARVEGLVARYDFLAGYRFDD